MTTQLTRSGPSASAAIRATSAESIPPESATSDALEAVLAHVVAQAELQRLVDLRHRVERLGELRLDARRSARAPRAGRARARSRPAAARRARARPLARAAAGLGASSRSQSTSSSANWAARASVSPCRRDDHAVPVEDQLVLAADQVADRERGAGLAGPLLHHPLPIGAPAAVVRRGRGVDDQARAGERLHRGGRARVPDVLADRQPDARPRDLDQRRRVARLEVAALVEDAVVREAGSCGRRRGPARPPSTATEL